MPYLNDKYHIMILVEQYCGHDDQRLDGLNANSIHKEYRKSQRFIHDMILTEVCVGIFNPI